MDCRMIIGEDRAGKLKASVQLQKTLRSGWHKLGIRNYVKVLNCLQDIILSLIQYKGVNIRNFYAFLKLFIHLQSV